MTGPSHSSRASAYDVKLTKAHVLRHAPAGTQGHEAALVDIAQDLLLRHLSDEGLLELLVFKGGTALRKLYSGSEGRFSLDLDFSVRELGVDAEEVQQLLDDIVVGLELGPFTYDIAVRRGKRTLVIESPLGTTGALTSKLDVNPPPWLEPQLRPWVYMKVHEAYGGPLPELPCVRLEENMAEKIARLNRTTTARDVYDLVWLWTKYRRGPDPIVDAALVRRLAVLKIWVDAHGLSAANTVWKPGHEAAPFDADHWLRTRSAADFDVEDIGQLAVPTPDIDELAKALRTHYAFLSELDADEKQVAGLDGSDRRLVLDMVAELPTSRLTTGTCW